MSDISIGIALDPHGNPVPIEEADRIRHYYRCPRCGEFLVPRKGPKISHYYAHEKGVQDNSPCPLGYGENYEDLVDEYRTSDVEESEKKRQLRIYIRQVHDDWLELFAVLPAISLESVDDLSSINQKIDELTIETKGISSSPSEEAFHPSEPEVEVQLDPTVDEYKLEISGPEEFDSILGTWTGEGLEPGVLFVGDQRRAKKHTTDRRIRDDEWVYAVVETVPNALPDAAKEFRLGDHQIIGFPVIDDTTGIFDEYVEVSDREEYGFEANVMLPRAANPTSDKPILGSPGSPILIGIRPAEDVDPVFEVIPIPKERSEPVEMEQTGPGNPRFYLNEFPATGSRKISIHQQRSNRHRFVHLHADENPPEWPQTRISDSEIQCGLRVQTSDGDELLSPLQEQTSMTIDANEITMNPFEIVGPEGLEVETRVRFPPEAELGPVFSRTLTVGESFTELRSWLSEQCCELRIRFESLGSVSVEFTYGGESA